MSGYYEDQVDWLDVLIRTPADQRGINSDEEYLHHQQELARFMERFHARLDEICRRWNESPESSGRELWASRRGKWEVTVHGRVIDGRRSVRTAHMRFLARTRRLIIRAGSADPFPFEVNDTPSGMRVRPLGAIQELGMTAKGAGDYFSKTIIEALRDEEEQPQPESR